MLGKALVLGALVLSACGSGAQPSAASRSAPVADAARGKEVFTTIATPACSTCHTVQGLADGQIGPDLTHIGTVAGDRVKDPGYKGKAKDAAGYIRESIVDPNAYIPPKCPAGDCFKDIMPKDFGQKLTPQQLEDLVAYLLTRT